MWPKCKLTKFQFDASNSVCNAYIHLGLRVANHINQKKNFDWMEDNHQPITNVKKRSKFSYNLLSASFGGLKLDKAGQSKFIDFYT